MAWLEISRPLVLVKPGAFLCLHEVWQKSAEYSTENFTLVFINQLKSIKYDARNFFMDEELTHVQGG